MKGLFVVSAFIAMTALCWGLYGPAMHAGQHDMGGHLKPFVCVGLAYFGIAVVVPGVLLGGRGEKGQWTARGTFWSLVAGTTGAVGALGVVLAFKNHGNPIYVMPLIFGVAPVVNTFFTMYLNKSYRDAGPLFFAGMILVIAGAVAVLVFRPPPPPGKAVDIGMLERVMAMVWTAITAVCWGVYGPLLHKGQMGMDGSRLRPFICVGVAYFLIAVLVPLTILSQASEPGEWNVGGMMWSLAGGSFGALGALGLILAFNSGGKPIYVMPLVFGGAPVVNTITAMIIAQASFAAASALFYAGLIVVAAGAVVVLVFAPKAAVHAPK